MTNAVVTKEMKEAQKEFESLMHEIERKGTIPQPDEFMKLFRTGLEAGGFDFTSKEKIDDFRNKILQPKLDEKSEEVERLQKQAVKIILSSGATESQLKRGDFSKVNLTEKQQREIDALDEQMRGVQEEIYYIMGMACTLNEAWEALE